jgi:acyl-CoA synthetase (AMP-forming)/AMP-acid ligase II
VIRRPPLHYPARPFQHFLADAADRLPERIGLDFEGETYTYREMDSVGNAFCRALRGLGAQPQQRAALVVPNRPEWLLAAHGLYQTGVSTVMPNPVWKDDELRHVFELTTPALVVADAASAEIVDRVCGAAVRVCVDDPAPAGWLSFWNLVFDHPGTRPAPVELDLATAECALPFSSGTTGLPKAVRHSHRSIVNATISWKSTAGIRETDRLQFFLPLFGIYGISTVAAAFSAGARLTLFRRFDLTTMLEHVQRERVTIGFAAAPIAVALANRDDLESYDLSSLRFLIWAATPIAPDLAKRVTARTGVGWVHAYGTTEVPPLYCNPVERPELWRLDTPGLPANDVQTRIIDPETGVDVSVGQEGEICVRAPFAMLGYLPEEANEGTFWPGGWYKTGDIGWLELGGWLHITDRAKEMLKVSGFAVAPVEIEKLLFSHPDVADVAVYGIPDERFGEAATAAVVLRPGATCSAEDIIAFTRERLSGYKQVRRVRFVDEVPRNPAGKVLRRLLKAADPAVAQEVPGW